MHTVSAGGVDIPALGFGTWQISGPDCVRAVSEAIDVGYRHIDTAAMYGNEAEVGQAIRDNVTPRDQVFLTTKVWRDQLGRDALPRSVETSLAKMKLDHVDLVLVHWPDPATPLAETMAALNAVKARGLTRAIGVANFPSALFREAQALSEATLATDQVEYHPFLGVDKILGAARDTGSSVTAWSPLARGKIVGDPVLEGIAKAHGKDVGQIALRWLVQQPGVIAIPKTATLARMRSNLDIFDFELSAEEMDAIFALASPQGRLISPEWAPTWDV
jgi:diketogulonate reductase-like aldo/keto reductase